MNRKIKGYSEVFEFGVIVLIIIGGLVAFVIGPR